MKKITFILFALITGTTFAQNTANADAQVSAGIISPISIGAGTLLDFGKIEKTVAAQTVTITYDGSIWLRTGGLASGFSGSTFVVKASKDFVYDVSYDSSIDLTNQTSGSNETMTVAGFEHFENSGALNLTGTGNNQDLHVGAALSVLANQAEGIYTGTTNVTVTYQ